MLEKVSGLGGLAAISCECLNHYADFQITMYLKIFIIIRWFTQACFPTAWFLPICRKRV